MVIQIGVPYILSHGEFTRLCADIVWNDETHQLYYETEKKYGQYFTTDVSDAFVVTLLLFAMEKGADIVCKGGISERLYYQLDNYLIPTISKSIPKYGYQTQIEAEKLHIVYNSKGVGTGLSCGVDSFYSVMKNLEHGENSNLQLTHLCFFNAGSNGGLGGKTARDVFLMRRNQFKKVADEIGLPLISCDCNINEFLQQVHVKTHTFRTLSIPLALQKLFHLYYFSSGYNVNDFRMDEHDSAYYDLLTLPNLSNDNIRFVSVGGETTRIGKVDYISKFPVVQRHLHVCLDNKNTESVCNCGKCNKCKRTLLNIYLCDALANFETVFDIDFFNQHKDEYIRWAMKVGRGKHSEADMPEIYNLLKQRKLIGLKNYMLFYIDFPFRAFRKVGNITKNIIHKGV